MVHCDCADVSVRNCLIVSIAFFLVFSGFNGAQRFATSAKEGSEERDISFAIIYTVIPFATLLVGPIIKRISAHKVFFAATSCYVLYIAANIKVIAFALYFCSVLVGVAAPCLWIARNVFITQCSNHNEIFHQQALNSKLGSFNGIFWGIFQFSACLGSIIGALLFSFNGSIVFLYILFTFVCVIGVFTFCCIKPMNLNQNIQSIQSIPMINTKETNDNIPMDDVENTEVDIMRMMDTKDISIKSELIGSGKKIISVLKEFNFWCLVPLSMYSGLEMAFDSADFPVLITDNSAKFYILGYYGLISVIASFIIGKISDKIHRLYIILMLFVLHQIAWISLYFYKDTIYDKQNNIIFVVFATIFGIGFASIVTQKNALIPILLSNESEVYQSIKLVESPSAAFVFYFHSYLNFSTKILINSIVLCLAIIPFFFPTIQKLLKPEKNKTDNCTKEQLQQF